MGAWTPQIPSAATCPLPLDHFAGSPMTPKRFLRSTIAVILGIVVILMVVEGLELGLVALLNGGLTTDPEIYFAVRNMGGFLAGKLFYNTAAAIAAGYLTARMAGYAELKHGAVLAVVQTLAFGWALTQPDMARWTPGWMWAALIVLTFAGILVGAGYRALSQQPG